MRAGHILLLIICISSVAPAASAISVEMHNNSVGDWFEYSGYGISLANQMAASYSDTNNTSFVGFEIQHDEPLRFEVIERGDCDFGEWSGSCLRSEASHVLNLTLEWQSNSTEFDDDKMILNVTTTILHEEPYSTSQWDRERRTVSISSWFLGDGEENLVETETTTLVTTHSSLARPDVLREGDTWETVLTVDKSDTIRQRVNRQAWNQTGSSIEETRQVTFLVEAESSVHTVKKDWPTLRLREQAVGEENYSVVYLTELGWPVRTEEYQEGVLVQATTLTDYSSSAETGPTETTIESTPAVGFIASLALLGFAASYRKKSLTNE